MGRKCRDRNIDFVPIIKGIRPYGLLPGTSPDVILNLDEFEAIRLLDYLHLNQDEAAQRMEVSRPTLTRIYEKARTNIARVLVEGAGLVIESGEGVLRQKRYHCPDCHYQSDLVASDFTQCPQCHSEKITLFNDCFHRNCDDCDHCGRKGRRRCHKKPHEQ